MNNKIALIKTTSSIFLAIVLVAGTITTASVYGQSSNAPFITEDELEAALADVVTQEDLQAALADVVTQEDLQAALADVISSDSIYRAVGQFDTTSGDGFVQSVALCNPGDTVLSGSYLSFNIGNADGIIDNALPTDDGWEIRAIGPASPSNAVSFQAIAQCFDNL